MPLSNLQILAFEIGKNCDMCKEHVECPVNIKDRFNGKPYELTIDKIVETAHKAKDLGFKGWIAYHRYNSPTMYWPRVRDCIRSLDGFKHLLWDSGNQLTEEMIPYFDTIHITNYRNHDFTEWQNKYPEVNWIVRDITLDDRLNQENWGNRNEFVICNRPKYIELPIDFAGNVTLCCYDFNAKEAFGNIFEEDFTSIIENKYKQVTESLTGCSNMAPEICKRCPYQYRNLNVF